MPCMQSLVDRALYPGWFFCAVVLTAEEGRAADCHQLPWHCCSPNHMLKTAFVSSWQQSHRVIVLHSS
jgi:hypothetical protein